MDITSDIIAKFRQTHRAFSDATKWPDDVITQALNEAACETGSKRWGVYSDNPQNLKQRGMFFYAAHWLSSFYGKTAADPTKVESGARLNISAKSVGDESVQYRITEMENTGNDWLSTTIYGTQFWRIKKRVGMGAMTV